MDRWDVEAALAGAGFPDAGEEAAQLIAAARGIDEVLRGLVARRLDGEPLEWLTGMVTFCGHVIGIDPGVYVPRPQSELVALRALARLPADGLAVDLATGCGAIALTLGRGSPGARVVATDVDPLACACAVANGVEVLCGDLGRPLPVELHGQVDVVVAVVPYVPTEEMGFLPRDVQRHEPVGALDGGPGGLRFLARAAAWGSRLLRPGGSLVLELGGTQDEALAPVLEECGFELVGRLTDEDGDLRGVEACRYARRVGEVHVSSRDEVRKWLAENHRSDEGVWFVFTKGKARTVDYDDVVEEAICFGWVDSKSRSYDDQRTTLYLAPRRSGSKWSASNADRVRRLSEAGLMEPSGLAAVEEARASGAWPAD